MRTLDYRNEENNFQVLIELWSKNIKKVAEFVLNFFLAFVGFFILQAHFTSRLLIYQPMDFEDVFSLYQTRLFRMLELLLAPKSSILAF